MSTNGHEEGIHTLRVRREVEIAAPIDISFEALLAELGPEGEMPGGQPFPMVIEAKVGGRWFRDLGNDAGHLWGHVQVIKPPSLLEICGPLFMSYPAISHVQYRLKEEGGKTLLSVLHRAMGQIPKEDREGVESGWEYNIQRVREIAEARAHR
ncbi:MAG: SRPBCC domain-containing protein [Phycisphaeraceae bacterium]|nr:MAG: SRPBCC domain-containing protein [Phycisphaeraceae bacterium]